MSPKQDRYPRAAAAAAYLKPDYPPAAAKALYSWVRTVPGLTPAERDVLEAYARCANADGSWVFASRRKLAEKSGRSDSAVKTASRKLLELGLLGVDDSPESPVWRYYGGTTRRRAIRMPAEAWPPELLAEINAAREAKGWPALDDANRPALALEPKGRRADAGVANPNRRRKDVRAAELAAGALEGAAEVVASTPAPVAADLGRAIGEALAGGVGGIVGAAAGDPVVSVLAAALDSATRMITTLEATVARLAERLDRLAPPLVTDPPGGVCETPEGGFAKPAGGVCETPDLDVVTSTTYLGEETGPAVGVHAEVVSGPASTAEAGKINPPRRRSGDPRRKASPTPSRPRARRRRAAYLVSAEAVEVYRSAIPPAIKRYIPDHATGRVLAAITAELERLGAHVAHDASGELAARITERAEDWRYRMPDARDPVAVVTGLIVRGPEGGPTATPWCGQCDGPALHRRWLTDDEGRAPRHCPNCHPALAHTRAAATEAAADPIEVAA